MRNKEQELKIDPTDLLDAITNLSPVTYQYYTNLSRRKIIFNTYVADDIVENVILPLIEMDNDETGAPIELLISTPGGSLFDGMVLCDVIDQMKTPLTITILGYVYSMGGIIAMAGYNNSNVKKRCYAHSTALLHGGSTMMSGSMSSVKDTMEFQNKFERKIREYTLSHSKITPEEYDLMERKEWYFTADEMIEKGIVDEIIGKE